MAHTSATINVIHDHDQQRFVTELNGHEAVLQYRHPTPDSIDFYRTYTPPELRGHGLAQRLVSVGLAYAREHHWQIIASCSYVARYLDRESAANRTE